MIGPAPDFMDWVEVDLDGWHLKEGAPEDVRQAFAAYMREISMGLDDGTGMDE